MRRKASRVIALGRLLVAVGDTVMNAEALAAAYADVQREYFHQLKTDMETVRGMKTWLCECGNEVLSVGKPEPMRWTDGHVCYAGPGRQ